MSEDFNDNKTIQAQSSEAISGGGSGIGVDADYVRPAEDLDQDLYQVDFPVFVFNVSAIVKPFLKCISSIVIVGVLFVSHLKP